MFEAEFWVAVAFVIFVGVLGYFGVHRLLLKGIDDRRDRIKVEFDEAHRLKAEAEALLAAYRRKQHEAEDEARAIVASAKAEAERLAIEAEAKLEEFVARRTKMAENKISQAEAQALADVRSAAADAAVAAAEALLTRTVKDKVADDLIAKGIGGIAPGLVAAAVVEDTPGNEGELVGRHYCKHCCDVTVALPPGGRGGGQGGATTEGRGWTASVGR